MAVALRPLVFWIISLTLVMFSGLASGVTFEPLTRRDKDEDSFFFHNYKPEIFYDNRVLPEDIEVNVYFYKEYIKRVFFIVEKDHSPVSLTVTPCLAPVEWKILHRTSPDLQGKETPWQNQFQVNNVQPSPQWNYFGKERQTFFHQGLSEGLYVLEMDSRGKNTGVKLYFTTSTNSTQPYPQLPSNPTIRALKSRKDSLMVSWNPVDLPRTESRVKIEYCITINEVQNFETMCGYTAAMNGDLPPTPPPSSGFGFSWEKIAKKKLAVKHKEAKKTLSAKQKVIPLECLGSSTRHVFRNLQEGKTYFIDVFAVNQKTNYSSGYKGLVVLTKDSYSDQRIKFNRMIDVDLAEKKNFTALLKFQGSFRQPNIWIFTQSCSGPGEIQLKVSGSNGGAPLLDTSVMESNTNVVNGITNGTYLLTLRSKSSTNKTARIWLSKRIHKYPFPVLPEDRKLKAFDSLTTCESVTLVWKTTVEEKVCYCLYKRLATDPDQDVTFPSMDGSCEDESKRKDENKILCRRYHKFSKNRISDVIMQKIRGLQPFTTYVFDVLVTKYGGKTLAYDSVWVTTSKKCNHHVRRR